MFELFQIILEAKKGELEEENVKKIVGGILDAQNDGCIDIDVNPNPNRLDKISLLMMERYQIPSDVLARYTLAVAAKALESIKVSPTIVIEIVGK